MKDKPILAIAVLLLIAVGVAVYMYSTQTTNAPIVPIVPLQNASVKDATYIVDGQSVTLVNGKSEVEAAPGSASKVVTQYFGNEAVGDLNADGVPDTAFLITQNSGGSGTFYYVVGAIKTANGYSGTAAVLLGDRIAPQTTEIKNGQVIVNYADRNLGESFAAQPSVGKSLFLKLDPTTMQFGEVVQNFEGEADTSKMTLTMKAWNWVSTSYGNGSSTVPKVANKFVLTFKGPNTFSATTDCNGVSGGYTATGNTLTFGNMMSTLMYCDGSQESGFSKALGEVKGYHFTSKGELVFDLKQDGGTMVFR